MNPEQTSVDVRPNWLINIQAPNTELNTLCVDGKSYLYTIVIKGLGGKLPYAVGGKIQDGSLFISEEVDITFVPYILRHEIRHEVKYANIPPEEACLLALREELQEVATELPEKYAQYLIGRRAFFAALVDIYNDPEQRKAKGPEAVEGIVNANTHIQSVGSKDTIPKGTFRAELLTHQDIGMQMADAYIQQVDFVPPGVFSSDYTPEQRAAIAGVHRLGEALAQLYPEIADLYRDLTNPRTYLQIAQQYLPDIAEKNPIFAARVVGCAMRQLIPPREQAELTAVHRAMALHRQIGEIGSQRYSDHQRAASKMRHKTGSIDTEAMVRARGRTPWTNEEKKVVLDILLSDKVYQHHNGTPDYKKIAEVLNEIYHNGAEVRYANSVMSFVAHERMKKRKMGEVI